MGRLYDYIAARMALPRNERVGWEDDFALEVDDALADVEAGVATDAVVADRVTSGPLTQAAVSATVAAEIEDSGSPVAEALSDKVGEQEFAASGFGGTLLKTVSDIINGVPVDALSAVPRTEHAAILAGTSTYDATTDIQSLLTDMSHGALTFPRGRWNHGNLVIGDVADFKLIGYGSVHHLTGTATSTGDSAGGLGFQMMGTVHGFEAFGLRVVGDGDVSHKHKGFWCRSGQDLADINWHDLSVEQTIVGYSINADLSGSVDGFRWENLIAKDIQGIASGEGYGFHLAYQNAQTTRARMHGLYAKNCKRHALYIARAQDYELDGLMVVGHRSTLTAGEQVDVTDGWGKLRAAVNVARSKHGRLSKITGVNGYDGYVTIVPNPEGTGAVEMFDIAIEETVLRNPRNAVPMMTIGDANPSVAGYPSAIVVEDTKIYADYSEVPGVLSQSAIVVNAGKNIKVKGTRGTILGVNQSTSAVNIQGRGEGAGTSTYNDEISVDDTNVHMETTNASPCRAVRVESLACASGSDITIRGSDATGDAANSVVHLAATSTNPNLRVANRQGECVGLYTAGDPTPSVGRGVTQLDIANASATSITGLDDAAEGQVVTLQFYDANTTLVNSATLRMGSGANMVSANRRVVVLRYHSGAWYESARATS